MSDDVSLEFHGIHDMPPEGDLCALFRWVEGDRILPIWLSPDDGAYTQAKLQGYNSKRPAAIDVLIDLIEELGGVTSIRIVHQYEGAFMVDIAVASGQVLDSRMSDALIVADYFDQQIQIVPDVLQSTAVFLTPEDLEEYFQLQFEPADTDEDDDQPHDAAKDEDFAEMMRSLGMSEEELLGEDNSNSDNTVSNDDEGEQGSGTDSDGDDGNNPAEDR
ncbi:bifunctional nuclease domain-containing protein [Corynebacterium camporealensis]